MSNISSKPSNHKKWYLIFGVFVVIVAITNNINDKKPTNDLSKGTEIADVTNVPSIPELSTPATPKLSCFDSYRCLIELADTLLQLAQQDMRGMGGRYYNNVFNRVAVMFYQSTNNDKYIRLMLEEVSNQPEGSRLRARDVLNEQLKLADLLNDKPLIQQYTAKAKQLLQQPGNLTADRLYLRLEWLAKATGEPDESWLTLFTPYMRNEIIVTYVEEGLKQSTQIGLDRLEKYKKHLSERANEKTQLKVLEQIVDKKQWSKWLFVLQENPELFEKIMSLVDGNDRDAALLPSEQVPWEFLKSHILSKTLPSDIRGGMYSYARFSARDLNAKEISSFFSLVSVFDAADKEDFAQYIVKQMIRNKRYQQAREIVKLLIKNNRNIYYVTSLIEAAANPKPKQPEQFTQSDYNKYIKNDAVNGACQYLKEMVSSRILFSKITSGDSGAILKEQGAKIESSCALTEEPCGAVFYLHRLSHYAGKRLSIPKSMLKHIKQTPNQSPKALACNAYYLIGQLPFIIKSNDPDFLNETISFLENELAHPIQFNNELGSSIDRKLYFEGLTRGLYISIKNNDIDTAKRLAQLIIKEDFDFSYVLFYLDFLLEKSQEASAFESEFKLAVSFINQFEFDDENRERAISHIVSSYINSPYIYRKFLEEKKQDELISLLTNLKHLLSEQNLYKVLVKITSLAESNDDRMPSEKMLDLFTEYSLNFLLKSIEEKASQDKASEIIFHAINKEVLENKKSFDITNVIRLLKQYKVEIYLNQGVRINIGELLRAPSPGSLPGLPIDNTSQEKYTDSVVYHNVARLSAELKKQKNQHSQNLVSRKLETQTNVLLEKLIKLTILNGNIQKVKRITPIYAQDKAYVDYINYGIGKALSSKKNANGLLYAVELYQLLPNDKYSQSNSEKELEENASSLVKVLSLKPLSREMHRIFCSLVAENHLDLAEQFLIAKPKLYSKIGYGYLDEPQLQCSIDLAIKKQSPSILDRVFKTLGPYDKEALISSVMARAAQVKNKQENESVNLEAKKKGLDGDNK
ncbi:MAG: hypothetical protein OFPII_41850 [Osedax symbiont Rs1]|nr:MAG: hypothetical protein OFPII_41850 [Osedax symbiont Rs1]